MINSAWVSIQLSLTLGDPYAQHCIWGYLRLLLRRMSEDSTLVHVTSAWYEKNQYVGQKYRVIGHIMKTHLALTDVPYYCSLCLFQCQQWNDLIKQIQGGQVIICICSIWAGKLCLLEMYLLCNVKRTIKGLLYNCIL